jgi:16S rRNA (guanine527-N7)-methyltransferase
MVTHHLLDSLVVLPHLPMPEAEPRLADAGSGAGLPGIPVAVARPQWRVMLAESNQKKAAFLRQAAIELGLSNVEVHQGRVESWRPGRPFAVVISRAFADLSAFIAACRHLVSADGVLAAMKGVFPGEELKHLPRGCDCGRVIALKTPLLDVERHLVLCKVTP